MDRARTAALVPRAARARTAVNARMAHLVPVGAAAVAAGVGTKGNVQRVNVRTVSDRTGNVTTASDSTTVSDAKDGRAAPSRASKP